MNATESILDENPLETPTIPEDVRANVIELGSIMSMKLSRNYRLCKRGPSVSALDVSDIASSRTELESAQVTWLASIAAELCVRLRNRTR